MNNTCQNKSFSVLHPGVRYRVKKEFYDYNGERYQVDEEMVFIDYNFVPYESGLSLFFRTHNRDLQIMLCNREGLQQHIVHELGTYFERQQ